MIFPPLYFELIEASFFIAKFLYDLQIMFFLNEACRKMRKICLLYEKLIASIHKLRFKNLEKFANNFSVNFLYLQSVIAD